MHDAIRLKDAAALDRVLEQAGGGPVLIFKHSATCPVSRRAMTEFRALLAGTARPDQPFTAAYLVVQEDRPVSQEVARRLGVEHQSPQAIVVQGGRVSWHASHWNVTAAAMGAALSPKL